MIPGFILKVVSYFSASMAWKVGLGWPTHFGGMSDPTVWIYPLCLDSITNHISCLTLAHILRVALRDSLKFHVRIQECKGGFGWGEHVEQVSAMKTCGVNWDVKLWLVPLQCKALQATAAHIRMSTNFEIQSGARAELLAVWKSVGTSKKYGILSNHGEINW